MRETEHFYSLVRLGLILGPLLAGVLVVARIFQPAMTITPSVPHSSIASAFSGLVVSSDASILNPPRAYSDLRSAPKTIIVEATPEAIDPRELIAKFQSGITAMETSSDNETRREGARQVRIAAINGYEPARMLIAREFPRSPLIRSIVRPPKRCDFRSIQFSFRGRKATAIDVPWRFWRLIFPVAMSSRSMQLIC